jgi:peptidoglycan/LPS O-acetylase OafA/YrhL
LRGSAELIDYKKLSPGLSSALNAARTVAACYVVLEHVISARFFADRPPALLRFGQEAVLVFFLLSGFLIFANERQRALRPSGYYLRRLRRIYPPLIVAIAVSTLVALSNHDLAQRFVPAELWATLFSVQDISFLKPGVIADPYLGNAPLWSLSYEVFFYIIFPPVLMAWTARPRLTNNIIGPACCVLYGLYALAPNHFVLVAAYFQAWWCGAMAAEAYQRGGRSVASMWKTYRWLLALCGTAAAVAWWTGGGSIAGEGIGYYPLLPLRHFVFCAVALAILFGGIGKALLPLLWKVRKPSAALSRISYTIYVIHFPLLVQWQFASGPWGFAAALALVLVISRLTEYELPVLLSRLGRRVDTAPSNLQPAVVIR